MKQRLELNNRLLLLMLKEYNIKLKKTVLTPEAGVYYINQPAPDKMINIFNNNFSNTIVTGNYPTPYISIIY